MGTLRHYWSSLWAPFFWHIRISWDHLALIGTFSDCLLGLPDGTMCTNWGNLFWETVIHCGAMEACSSCQCSLALSPIPLLILFISQNIVSLFFLHVLKRCQNLQLPSALFSAEAFKDVANPEDIPKYASSATNSTNYAVNSAPSPPWLASLWSQRLAGPCCIQLAWLRQPGQLGALATRITTPLSPSSTAHQDKEFSTSNPVEISPNSQSSLQ